jgi:PilZ domain
MTLAAAPRRSNRRLTARYACRLNVRYKSGRDWHPATAMDVSPQGCRLRVGEDLERGGDIALSFSRHEDVDAVHAVQVTGVVIWCRFEGLSHQAGIHFKTSDALAEILSDLP